MWTAEDVRSRFIEAAEIERRMHVKGLPTAGNAWPSYRFDAEDRAGWDDRAKQDDLEAWQGRKTTESREIARWQEVYFVWTLQFIKRDADRRRVWIWARCMSGGPSFVSICEKRGWVRRTEYARLERTFSSIARKLTNNGSVFVAADILPLAQKDDAGHTEAQMVGLRARLGKQHSHPPFRTESHHDALTTPEAVAAFSQHLADTNDLRRKARLRKALRGVPGELAGAAEAA